MGRVSTRWALGAVALVSFAATAAAGVAGDRAAAHGGGHGIAMAVDEANVLVGDASQITPSAAFRTLGAAPAVGGAAADAILDGGADLRTAVRRQAASVCGDGSRVRVLYRSSP